MSETLATRSFAPQDLLHFAKLSGDWNPIHVDPIAARRLLIGQLVAHGMLTMLWSIDTHFAHGGQTPAQITAFFQRSILPGEKLALIRTQPEAGTTRLSLQHDGEEAASILLRGAGASIPHTIPNTSPKREIPKDFTFAQLKAASGAIPVAANHTETQNLFPAACSSLGLMPVASIMALSRIVGMECPGLHSLYTGLDLTLAPAQTTPEIHWRIIRHAAPFAPIKIEATGAGITAKIDAFVRPAPVQQPGMQEIARHITPNSYTGKHAAIIGGSRGLGELVAKLIAASGGEVTITYHHGAADAQRVVDEITAHGGKARALHATVSDAPNLAKALNAATHLFYFATPRIAAQKSPTLDDALYQSYKRIYADDFAQLVTDLASHIPGSIKIFYPSTIFVEEQPKHFAEYIKAKQDGEKICQSLNKKFPNITIIISRLPRMNTDQAASLIPQPTKPALQEMQRVVKEMENHDAS